jgi:DNA-binding NtrC family response regulator
MRATDLDLRELLQFDPERALIQFAGQRALLIDAVALGMLRGELVRTLGFTGARGVLTRFGYAHGWRMAEGLRDAFPWDDEGEWRRAGGQLHMLQGLVRVELPRREPGAPPSPFAEAYWHESYEAEQHLLLLGQADEPVCWTLTGFASGYLSCCNGQEVYCLEERCRARGDPVCHVVGKTREGWGEALTPHLPFYERQCLERALARVAEELKAVERRLRARRQELARDARGELDRSGIVAQSEPMRRALELARRVAGVDSTILLTGESGVGKERFARLIHEASPRAAGPLLAVNCGAVPEGLLESELFGHARGSFTGATQDRPGLFEAASGGTLFLDEIGEVPSAMQVKLLRAVQEREVRRVGENRTRTVNVRVLAATNRDLSREVKEGRFRQDLYYRLRVVELRVPPLRERREDILALGRLFLAEASERTGRRATGFTPKAARQLVRYRWPGNVRELENAVERAVVLCRGGRVDLEDLPEEVARALPGDHVPGDARSLDEVERDYILAVLRDCEGNKPQAAERLGIGVATLYRKLKSYDVEPPTGA